MFLGHYGLALAAKRIAPRESLGATVAASQWVDLLWPVFLLLGWESVRVAPGFMAANSLEFVHYPFTHSLAAAVFWAVLVGAGWFLLTRRGRGAWILGGLVASHWFLDLPFHAADLPLWPGSETRLGGGLWNSVPLTLAGEFLLFLGGLAIYHGATEARDRVGRWGFWGLVALLPLFYLSSFSGPPPSASALAWGGLTLWLVVPWAHWVDRHRFPRDRRMAPAPADQNSTLNPKVGRSPTLSRGRSRSG